MYLYKSNDGLKGCQTDIRKMSGEWVQNQEWKSRSNRAPPQNNHAIAIAIPIAIEQRHSIGETMVEIYDIAFLLASSSSSSSSSSKQNCLSQKFSARINIQWKIIN